jgi:predicted acyltransferase
VVFPLFLFVVGMSVPYAIERRLRNGYTGLSTIAHILTRTLALAIMGVFIVNTEQGLSPDAGMSMPLFRTLMVTAFFMIWNIYPKSDGRIRYLHLALQLLGVLILLYLAFIYRDARGGVMQARWWGILGQIGWTYLVCSIIYLFVRNRITHIFLFWLGFILLCMVQSSDLIPRESFVNTLLQTFNIGTGANVAFTMGGILFTLLIVRYAGMTPRRKVFFLLLTMLLLLIAATLSRNLWIISKNLGTPSWVLYCTAIAIGAYGLFNGAVVRGKAAWFNIIKPAGTATLTSYLIPYLLYSLFYGFLSLSFPDWMKEGGVGLITSALFAFLCVGITALFSRAGIRIKL